MAGFTKLFNSILDSTIWQEPNETRILWITMLAMCDARGEVQASIPGLARRAGITLFECESGLVVLSSPDAYSRTKDHDGRRIEEVDGGWRLLNHGRYRALLSAEERKEYNRKKQAEFRASRKNVVNDTSMTVNDNKQSQHISEADTEAEVDTNPPSLPIEEKSERARAVTPIEEIQKRINDLKPEWGKPAHWSYTEQYSLQGGTATQIGELTQSDWAMLKLYLNTFMPEGAAYWQPRSRSKFVETFADTFGAAVRWAGKTGNSPKQPQTKKDGWK